VAVLLPVEGVFFRPDGTPFYKMALHFGHWDEDLLFNELTGFLNGGVANPLSRDYSLGSVKRFGIQNLQT
jgi:hypothetical protein